MSRGPFGRYLVIGVRRYRGHEPGTVFDAQIPRAVEERAVRRGNIRVLERITPALEPDSYVLPDDWPPPRAADTPAIPRRRKAPLS